MTTSVRRLDVRELVARIARGMELPPALALAVVHQESGFAPNAYRPEPGWYDRHIAPARARYGRSPIFGRRELWGSYGLTQVLAATAYDQGYPVELDPRTGGVSGGRTWPSLYDPGFSIRLGLRYLAGLIRRWGGIRAALAAYNAGTPSSSVGQAYARTVLGRAGAYLRAGWV